MEPIELTVGHERECFKNGVAVFGDCLLWLSDTPSEVIHAVVTDPPYGIKEYDSDQLEKRANGNGGIWRIPPEFDGNRRSPLPRFTALSSEDRARLERFFLDWAKSISRVLKPGGHVFLASNAYLSTRVFACLSEAGLEFRGQVNRIVRTLRGGDRPKNAESEFPDVSTLPRGCYEPWGLFRKPLPNGMTVAECLRTHGTGGLRRKADGRPFEDLIESTRTPKVEKDIANHPSLKPQAFLRQIVYAALPLGKGIVLDPFMGSGSTIAAAEFLGYESIGIERNQEYWEMAKAAVPRLVEVVTSENQYLLI
ncbi:DNA-methyltransferase [Gemmatimonadota bacterium]